MSTPATLKAKWFWYSILCVLSWGGWALLSKLGSKEIPADTMQFLFTFGALPVALVLLAARRFRLEKSPKGIGFAVLNGVLSGIGGLAFFAAFRSGGNTSVITAATSLYPMITVVLAVTILRERLTWVQVTGLGFAAAAFIIFSF
jgi:uncharacterized membrane protein